jgi:glycosyltransferase involved in cell wall biosynthesis
MRVLQLIDSLHAGGAERMAVNYANALAEQIDFSGIVVTRSEGYLLNNLKNKVSYFFIKKTNSFDFKSILRLKKIIIEKKIDVIHSHGTSFFTAFLLKLFYFKIKIIQHEHLGDRAQQSFIRNIPLLFCSLFFSKIIVVNKSLEKWYKKFGFKKILYLPNFPSIDEKQKPQTFLKGENLKRIVCLANIREEKNHFFIIELAQKLKYDFPEWTFHLVGKDTGDSYSASLKRIIETLNLSTIIFFYNSKPDIKNILEQAEIAILTSKSEGLPLALLEYGLFKKPVVVTAVGEIPDIIINKKNGFITKSGNTSEFYDYLSILIESKNIRTEFGENLFQTVQDNFSEQHVLNHYLNWISNE